MISPNVETFIGCDSSYRAADIVLYGAPFDSTTSYRPGARFGPSAIRHESFGLETYSPYQNADLTDFDIFDSGDLELCFGSSEAALADIEARAAEILHDGKLPLLLGGEHLVTLGAVQAVAVETPEMSSMGASSLRSAPTMLALDTVRMASSSCKKLTPPASGVPVPGKQEGSRQSRSMVR